MTAPCGAAVTAVCAGAPLAKLLIVTMAVAMAAVKKPAVINDVRRFIDGSPDGSCAKVTLTTILLIAQAQQPCCG
jgi:hypothetical protein